MDAVLEIKDLRVEFKTDSGVVRALRGVDLSVQSGEIVALAGESGCGKSVTARSILRLMPSPPASFRGGSVTLCGRDVLGASVEELRSMRGRDASMIFQDPMTSLDPTMRVGRQIAEALTVHKKVSAREAASEAIGLLERVGISDPEVRARQYPHELSGGMRQRIMIAIALSCSPKLIIADEPTTALDVTIQAQIIDLICELKRRSGTSVLLITHDMGVAAYAADRAAVMYAGRVVERGRMRDVMRSPAHPYTRALLACLPNARREGGRLAAIPGHPPDMRSEIQGCAFAPRCGSSMRICGMTPPPELDARDGDGHRAECWLLHPSCPQEARRA